MNNSVDWGKLYAQGRCKNIGIPWSEVEAYAVYTLKIDANYVRRGCLSLDAWEAMKLADQTSVETEDTMSDEKLRQLCEDGGVKATNDAPRSVLLEEIHKMEKKIETPIVKSKAKKTAKKKAVKK